MSGTDENKHVYRLQGLSCVNCAAQFERNVKEIEGVLDAHLNFGAAKITVFGEATIEQLEKAGAFDGIKVIPAQKRESFERIPFWKKRSNVTAFISALFVILGYSGQYVYGELSLVSVGLFAFAILVGGYDLFKVGVLNLLRFRFDMKTLMTIAVIGAAIIGEWGEGAVVVFLFAVSEALERYSMERAQKSIRELMEIAPTRALVRRGNREYEIDVEDVQVDDVILVKPGQKIAMDGIVIKGESSVNESAITGESIPLYKSVGDEVYAGTLNEEGVLEVRVTKRVENTTIAKIIHLVEEAQTGRAPSQQFIDQFAKYYTPVIIAVAVTLAAFPPLFFNGDWTEWIYRGLAVLVVGCPCALVISTPVAIVTAIGNAARKGVLIKGGIYLEEIGRLKAIAFDKTGTLTEGTPQVTNIQLLENICEQEFLGIAAAIERHSQHPLASAILRHAEHHDVNITGWQASDFLSITGKGAKATINGVTYYIGSPILFQELALLNEEVRKKIAALQSEGKTAMLLGTEKSIVGIIAVSDRVRKNAKQTIQALSQLGIKKTIMLTGDNNKTAEAIGKELGIAEIRAELLPEDKLRSIRKLREEYGAVAMVGDGVNDAPALASASVGIAMGGRGTDTALETADISLMADDLTKLPYTVRLSRKTLRIIKENITFSIGLKLIALLLIVPGWLTLWLAIFADMGATLIVILNSLRIINLKA